MWSDYISNFPWSLVLSGVDPAELSEISVDREVFQIIQGLQPPEENEKWTNGVFGSFLCTHEL